MSERHRKRPNGYDVLGITKRDLDEAENDAERQEIIDRALRDAGPLSSEDRDRVEDLRNEASRALHDRDYGLTQEGGPVDEGLPLEAEQPPEQPRRGRQKKGRTRADADEDAAARRVIDEELGEEDEREAPPPFELVEEPDDADAARRKRGSGGGSGRGRGDRTEVDLDDEGADTEALELGDGEAWYEVAYVGMGTSGEDLSGTIDVPADSPLQAEERAQQALRRRGVFITERLVVKKKKGTPKAPPVRPVKKKSRPAPRGDRTEVDLSGREDDEDDEDATDGGSGRSRRGGRGDRTEVHTEFDPEQIRNAGSLDELCNILEGLDALPRSGGRFYGRAEIAMLVGIIRNVERLAQQGRTLTRNAPLLAGFTNAVEGGRLLDKVMELYQAEFVDSERDDDDEDDDDEDDAPAKKKKKKKAESDPEDEEARRRTARGADRQRRLQEEEDLEEEADAEMEIMEPERTWVVKYEGVNEDEEEVKDSIEVPADNEKEARQEAARRLRERGIDPTKLKARKKGPGWFKRTMKAVVEWGESEEEMERKDKARQQKKIRKELKRQLKAGELTGRDAAEARRTIERIDEDLEATRGQRIASAAKRFPKKVLGAAGVYAVALPAVALYGLGRFLVSLTMGLSDAVDEGMKKGGI